MAEPCPDRINVDPGTEQVNGGSVSNRMGTHLLGAERRHPVADLGYVSLHKCMDAEARYRLMSPIEKYGFVWYSPGSDSGKGLCC